MTGGCLRLSFKHDHAGNPPRACIAGLTAAVWRLDCGDGRWQAQAAVQQPDETKWRVQPLPGPSAPNVALGVLPEPILDLVA